MASVHISKLVKARKGDWWITLCDGVTKYHSTFTAAYVYALAENAKTWKEGEEIGEITIGGEVPSYNLDSTAAAGKVK